jgi:hypothetical protein
MEECLKSIIAELHYLLNKQLLEVQIFTPGEYAPSERVA